MEFDEENNVEPMWEQVKQAMAESAREMCGSMREGGGNQKSVWWNDQLKMRLRERRVLGRSS